MNHKEILINETGNNSPFTNSPFLVVFGQLLIYFGPETCTNFLGILVEALLGSFWAQGMERSKMAKMYLLSLKLFIV